uniref:Uncharacterized protein n=1 Tax=Ditylenchus dipsaci TaxID=166011 RepID=A0A915EFK8_9BILA
MTNNPTVIIGDSVAQSFSRNRKGFFNLVKPDKEVLETVSDLYFGPLVENIIIWVGHEQLHTGRCLSEVLDQLKEVLTYLRRYKQIQIILLAPPLVPVAHSE